MLRPRTLGLAATLLALTCAAHGKQVQIAKEHFGASWPLIVDNGTLECRFALDRPDTPLVLFTHSTGTYALNGSARTIAGRSGWFPVDSIWKNNPARPGTKLSLAVLIDPALKLCGQR